MADLRRHRRLTRVGAWPAGAAGGAHRMARYRPPAVALVVLLVVAVVGGVIVENSWTARIPADAATTVLARTVPDPGGPARPVAGVDSSYRRWSAARASIA